MSVDTLRENWVRQALRNEDILPDYKMTVVGNSEKGEGFVGGISFVLVEGQNKERQNVEFNLVIKDSIRGEKMKMTKLAFDREILMYDEVLPLLNKAGKGKLVFTAIPKCYTTIVDGSYQAIVFENLKKLGYELHPVDYSMNQQHVKGIFYNYAKFHALSFALRQEDPEEFEAFKNKATDVFHEAIKIGENFIAFFEGIQDNFGTMLKEHEDKENSEKYEALGNIAEKMFLKTDYLEYEPYTVVCHSDCWNNNFMFKYSDQSKATPSEVAVIDWQVSTVATPIRDLVLSYYCNTAPEDLHHIYEMLDYYYEHFTANLKQLGYDAATLFPKAILREHFQKYAQMGLIMGMCVYQMPFMDKDNIPELTSVVQDENGEAEKDLSKTFIFKMNNIEGYYNKVMKLFKHFDEFGLL